MSAPAPFVIGVGRSGTTLLRLMLDAHPDLAIPSETHFIPDLLALEALYPSPEQVFNAIVGAQTWPNMALDAAILKTRLSRLQPFSVPEAIRAVFTLYAQDRGKRRWGDKTPPYRAAMGVIAAALPETHFIHIVRDGRDVALSYRGLWFGPGDEIEAQARFWKREIEAVRQQALKVPHLLELRYEDLIRHPEPSLRQICAYLDLPFHPAMLTYFLSSSERLAEFKQVFGTTDTDVDLARFVAIHAHTKMPPDPDRVGRWRYEMTEHEQVRFEEIAGALLHELGHETRRHGAGVTSHESIVG